MDLGPCQEPHSQIVKCAFSGHFGSKQFGQASSLVRHLEVGSYSSDDSRHITTWLAWVSTRVHS